MLRWIPQNWGCHQQVISFWFQPTKMGTEVFCLFCVSEVKISLVTSYYGRQSIKKLTVQPYFMIIDWLLVALSYAVQSAWNLLMFILNRINWSTVISKKIYIYFLKFPFEHFWHQNSWSISNSVLHVQILYCMFKPFPVSFKHKNCFFATVCWDMVRPTCKDFLTQPWGVHINFLFTLHPSGRKNTAGQSMTY